MASLIELLDAYPILETLVAVLPLGDLFNLSKTNSTIRAALHGFSNKLVLSPALLKAVRPALSIGRHNTLFWKNLKAKSPLCCSEPQHTRGEKVKGCLICSMPVCEACVIKASFGKRDENTFPNRIRSLCIECFNSGNSPPDTSFNKEENFIQNSYLMRTECVCTAKVGHLCLRCKTKQNFRLDSRDHQCHGAGCSKSKNDGLGGRVCLWCDSPLPRERSRAESRRDYDARHLLARRHSSYDQPPEESAEDSITDTTEQEAIWASSCLPSSRSKLSGKAGVVAPDHFEDARKHELERVSERRHFTAFTAEEQRWRRSEALRRYESTCRAPPPTRILGPVFPLISPIEIESQFASTASTLTAKDALPLPSYESCTQSSNIPSHRYQGCEENMTG